MTAIAIGLLGGCAPVDEPPRVDTVARCDAAVSGPSSGDWLFGGWTNTYYSLSFRRDGGAIRWDMSRVRHPSERWGEKPAMRASGRVTVVSPCSFEMSGSYDWSESPYQVGKDLRYRGTLDTRDRLSGEIYGAAREWLAMRFVRSR